MLTIQTNTAALGVLKALNSNSTQMDSVMKQLSTGFRVNTAADDR